ncbi:MAG: DNA polymerase III subunit gamma/tau [Gemmataceae bacterium]|nr:DNA polymerase III subunit gamma/tau [Gemmataceae bacterium]
MAKKASAPAAAPPPAPEGYTVLARRYRPQTFHDLIGLEPVARALANAITSSRVAHAYLFTGARGVGKTSTARILAKCLNCEKGPTPAPCGKCPLCVSITSGDDVDVVEMDAASNRGIDEIRDIRSNVQYRPSRGRFKIYIIDEVHMLTKEAFNALLKTLEEPPPHVKFIFATTDANKLPITILSRCQRFDFAGIALPRIVEQLKAIVASEGLKADDDALELVARRAGGSMRDAQSLLDQLLAFASDKLTADQVHHLLGTAGDDRILGLADCVVARDAAKALDLLAEASATGLQLGELLDQLISYWRDLMVVNVSGSAKGQELSVPPRCHEMLEKHARALSLDAILAGLDILNSAKARLRGSGHARTLAEMALVRLARLADLVSLSQLAATVAQMPRGPAAPAAHSRSAPAPAAEAVKKNSLTPAPESPPGSQGFREADWPAVLQQLGMIIGQMTATLLSKAGPPASAGPNALVFAFGPGYNREAEACSQPDKLSRIEQGLSRLAGHPVSVKITAAPALPQATRSDEGPREGRSPKEEAQRVPLVKQAVEVLGATISRVDEGFGEG